MAQNLLEIVSQFGRQFSASVYELIARTQRSDTSLPLGSFLQKSDFPQMSFRQYIDHDLGSQTERIDEGLTIRQHIDLPLGVHVQNRTG